MADKQESGFQAFALNVLLVASICTVGVAGYTIYNLNGTRSDIDKTILSIQKAVGKVNDLLDQVNSVEFNSGLLDKLSSSIVMYGYSGNATVSALVAKIKEFVVANPSPRISNRVQTSLSEFVDSGQLGSYCSLEELLTDVLSSLRVCSGELLVNSFNGVLPKVAAVLQDMNQSGIIHKIGNAVDGVDTAVSVLNNDFNGFDVGFFDKILATVKKLKKYADDHPSDKSITNKDQDLLEDMVTVYLPNVERCLDPLPGIKKAQYIERFGLSSVDFDSLSVLANFDGEDIESSEKYGKLMQVLREYSGGLSSHIVCSDGNFWFNLSDIVERAGKYGISGNVCAWLFNLIPFTGAINLGVGPEAVT